MNEEERRLRERYKAIDRRLNERFALLVLAIWLLLCGIWPIANPSHTEPSPMGMVDQMLHAAGGAYLVWRVIQYVFKKGEA